MNRRTPIAILASSILFVGIATASDSWIHIRVDGAGDERVRVNVPLKFAATVLAGVESDELRGGKIRIDREDFDDVDLRAMLAAVRDAEDAEFVRVRDEDSDVRVAKKDGMLLVHVDPREGGDESVRVQVPMHVVEALLQDAENTGELNVLAALEVLSGLGGQDLVTVRSDDETIRIWIDDSSTIED